MLIKDPYQFFPEYAAGFTGACQRAGLDLHTTAELLQKSSSTFGLLDPDARAAFDTTIEKSAGVFGRLLGRLFGRGGAQAAGKTALPAIAERAAGRVGQAFRPEMTAALRMGESPAAATTLQKLFQQRMGGQLVPFRGGGPLASIRGGASRAGAGGATARPMRQALPLRGADRAPQTWKLRGGPAIPTAQPFSRPPGGVPPVGGGGLPPAGGGAPRPPGVIPPAGGGGGLPPAGAGGAAAAGGVPPASIIPPKAPSAGGSRWASGDLLAALGSGGALAAGAAGSANFNPEGNAFSDSLGEQGRDVMKGVGVGGLSAAALAALGKRVPFLGALRPGMLIGAGAAAGGAGLPAYHAGERALRYGMMPAGFTPSYLDPEAMARGNGGSGIGGTDIGRRLRDGRSELSNIDQRINALKAGAGEGGLAGGLSTARHLGEIRELEARRREISQSLSRVVAGVERDQARWQGESAERLSTMTDLNRRMQSEGDRYARFLNRSNENSFGGLMANAWGNMTGAQGRADQYLGDMQALQAAMGRERNIGNTSLIPGNWRN